MLTVRLELDHARSNEHIPLSILEIRNTGTGTVEHGNYQYRIYPSQAEVKKLVQDTHVAVMSILQKQQPDCAEPYYPGFELRLFAAIWWAQAGNPTKLFAYTATWRKQHKAVFGSSPRWAFKPDILGRSWELTPWPWSRGTLEGFLRSNHAWDLVAKILAKHSWKEKWDLMHEYGDAGANHPSDA